jgi:hypothetical protein
MQQLALFTTADVGITAVKIGDTDTINVHDD